MIINEERKNIYKLQEPLTFMTFIHKCGTEPLLLAFTCLSYNILWRGKKRALCLERQMSHIQTHRGIWLMRVGSGKGKGYTAISRKLYEVYYICGKGWVGTHFTIVKCVL